MLRSIILSEVLFIFLHVTMAFAQVPPISSGRATITGKITEKKDGHPLAYAEVAVMRGSNVITGTVADELGNYRIGNIYPGRYTIVAYIVGFRKSQMEEDLKAGENNLDFALEASDISLQGVTVTANSQSNHETMQKLRMITSAPVFQTSTYHGAPSSLPSTIIQQSIPGAVQAPTGEVHIRGQHAEYSYNVDGLPVPETQSEGMTELFDPRVVDRISFLVGDLPAEYSDALAIIDVRTKIPATPFNASASSYVGSFNSSGESVSLASHTGNFAFFFAGSRKVTDRRIDTPLPDVFHDHGEDLFGLGKVQYIISPNDILALDIDQSRSSFQVPYDSTGGISLNDNQEGTDGFQNLIYRHGFGSDGNTGEFFFALTHRQGTLNYTPGVNDVPSFYFVGDSTTAYNIKENRRFDVYGAKSDVNLPEGEDAAFKLGASYYYTKGNENFSAFNSASLGPQSVEDLEGYDLGAYAQTTYQPMPIFQIDAGVRFDQHYAKGIGTESQVSPKIKLTYIPDLATTVYAYYGRLFVPVLVEQLRQITGASGTISQPTKAVRGNYFEAGVTESFGSSLSAKLLGYYTEENPGMDDNTIPGTDIQTAVNIQQIFVRGVELGLDYHPEGPLTGYFNLAVSHAQGVGSVTGGFLPALPPTTAFDLDHDQRITYSLGLNYDQSGYFAGLIGSYGSGLANGQTNGHVNPHLIFDGSLGKTIHLGSFNIKPEFFVNNILNHQYLLKGSFFSGASWGTPRSFMLKVSVGTD